MCTRVIEELPFAISDRAPRFGQMTPGLVGLLRLHRRKRSKDNADHASPAQLTQPPGRGLLCTSERGSEVAGEPLDDRFPLREDAVAPAGIEDLSLFNEGKRLFRPPLDSETGASEMSPTVKR